MPLHCFPFRRWQAALLVGGFVLVAGHAVDAATTNANPAPESLLSRLPDPAQWKKSPLEDVAKGTDPIVNDPTYKDMQGAARRNDLNRVFADLRTLTARLPDSHAPLHRARGLLALHFHMIGEAENSFRKAAQIAPASAVDRYCLGWVEMMQNRLPAASTDLRASVKASGSFAPGWMLLAVCEERQAKTADATADATRATQVAPNSSGPWMILADCKLKQGKQDAAVGDLEHARSLEPNSAVVNASLGRCYVETNHPAKAIEPYQVAVKAAPKNAFLCRQLGYCYLATGQAQAGEAVCRQGVRAHPEYAPAWDMLGLCYRREGKQREAVDAFEHAVKDAPRDLNARSHLDEARLGSAPTHA